MARLSSYFPSDTFGEVKKIDALDGVRIFFTNGDIAHLRPSGNAPQLRIYSVADSQERADQIVSAALAEPDGIFRKLEADFKA
jgi:phosphomannomutase